MLIAGFLIGAVATYEAKMQSPLWRVALILLAAAILVFLGAGFLHDAYERQRLEGMASQANSAGPDPKS